MPLNLILRAVPRDQVNTAVPARVGDRRSVTQGNLSIGRGPINDWVLADPLLSKTHCAVSLLDGRYVLTDLSTNGVFVNGSRQRMAKDSRIVLTDGDSFSLGGYVIEAEEPMETRPANQPDGETIAPFSPGRGAPPGAGAGGHASYLDRGEDDPLQTVPPRGRHADEPQPLHKFPAGSGAAANTGLPRGVDPFDLLDEPAHHEPEPDAQDMFKGQEADQSWSGAAQRDDVDAHDQAFKAPKPMWTGRLDDDAIDDLLGEDFPGSPSKAPPEKTRQSEPARGKTPPFHPAADNSFDDLLGDDPFGEEPATPKQTDPVADGGRQTTTAPPPKTEPSPFDEPEPVVVRQTPPPQTPSQTPSQTPARTAPPAGSDEARLVAAFLAGAGVGHLDLSQHDAEAYLRSMGELTRLMIERIREVLMSRAEVKRELGVDQTMLRPRNNNVLKFSVTPEDAVAALLLPSRPGYLPPMQATREALDDIGSHQVAVMAGVQTALFDLLKRFDPVTLEKRLTSGSFLDNIMPAARKARIWELFCATYKDIASEAQDDFGSLFGREFARGYNEQVKKQ